MIAKVKELFQRYLNGNEAAFVQLEEYNLNGREFAEILNGLNQKIIENSSIYKRLDEKRKLELQEHKNLKKNIENLLKNPKGLWIEDLKKLLK